MAHTNSYTCQVQTPDWDMIGTVPKAVITSRQQRLRLQLIPGQLATVVLSTWETSSLHWGSCQSCCDRSCVRVGNHDALVHSGATEKYWQHLLLNGREGRNWKHGERCREATWAVTLPQLCRLTHFQNSITCVSYPKFGVKLSSHYTM